MKNKKVAIYCRTSTRDQHPENQRIELVRYAEAMGFDYEVFEEQESTRKTRPVKNKLYLEAIQKKYNYILVWKFDRWSRSLQELITDLDVFRKNKIEFYSLKDNLKLDNSASNTMMINMIGVFAEFERSIISERTLLGLARAKKNGVKCGRPPGAKDKGRRRKSGYFIRWQNERGKVLI